MTRTLFFNRLRWTALAVVGASVLFVILYGSGGEKSSVPEKVAAYAEMPADKFRALTTPDQLRELDRMAQSEDIAAIKKYVHETYPDEQAASHELGHRIGEIAFREFGFDGLKYCDSMLDFGCFHGIAFAAIRTRGPDPQIGTLFWESCQKNPQPGDCLHGLGHAVVIIKNYDLLASFKECDHILGADSPNAFWCYDGVSMEDISRSGKDFKNPYLNSTDPRFPCNTIPEQYEAACVRNHLVLNADTLHWSDQQMIDFCREYKNERTVTECIHIVGNNKINRGGTAEDARAICKKAGPYEFNCLSGAIERFSMTKRFDAAKGLCDTVTSEKDHDICSEQVTWFKSSAGN